jgi:hypothetical protein
MSRPPCAALSVFCAMALCNGAVQAGQCSRACKTCEDTQMVAVVYSVTDLVIPLDAAVKNTKTLENSLMAVLRQAVDPESWVEKGGAATVNYFPLGMALVIKQTPANQKKVAELLSSLRDLQNLEVSLDMALVCVTPDVAQSFMKAADFKELNASARGRSVQATFMNQRQRTGWLEMFQGFRTTETMQAPRITVFNGQSGSLNVMDELEFLDSIDIDSIPSSGAGPEPIEQGLRADVLPVVSADRQHVRLHVNLFYGSKCNQLRLDQVVVIPHGGTFVCHLGKQVLQSPKTCKIPAFAGVCGVGLCSATVDLGAEEREVFLLVTPRVIVNKGK